MPQISIERRRRNLKFPKGKGREEMWSKAIKNKMQKNMNRKNYVTPADTFSRLILLKSNEREGKSYFYRFREVGCECKLLCKSLD
jgi:uncharacterized protein CbrC (UPF0167 family)